MSCRKLLAHGRCCLPQSTLRNTSGPNLWLVSFIEPRLRYASPWRKPALLLPACAALPPPLSTLIPYVTYSLFLFLSLICSLFYFPFLFTPPAPRTCFYRLDFVFVFFPSLHLFFVLNTCSLVCVCARPTALTSCSCN